jgi:hypothetical protein
MSCDVLEDGDGRLSPLIVFRLQSVDRHDDLSRANPLTGMGRTGHWTSCV